MEHKDMLHAAYRLKIAICYRNKRHLPLRDRCPYGLVILKKRQNNQSKLRWDLKSWPYICKAGKSLLAFLKKGDLESMLRIWLNLFPLIPSMKGAHHLLM
jgi:hypothetical protein